MPSKDEVLSAISETLMIPSIGEEDSSATVSKWDSLGHLLIQIALSDLTAGKADEVDGLAEAQSIGEILALLDAAGLLSTTSD